MADYSTICGYASPATSEATAKPGGASPMSFPRLASSPPPCDSGGPASMSTSQASADSLQREHAIRSLTEAVHSLNNLSVTRLAPTAAAAANDNAIISDAEVRAFMTLSQPPANQSDASSSAATTTTTGTAAAAATAAAVTSSGSPKFSPKHAAYSSPDLLFGPSPPPRVSVQEAAGEQLDASPTLRRAAPRLATRRREGVTRSWHEQDAVTPSRSSPGVARRIATAATAATAAEEEDEDDAEYLHADIGLRLSGFANSQDSMGLAVYQRSGATSASGTASSGTGPFLTAPQAPGMPANMMEISLEAVGSAAFAPDPASCRSGPSSSSSGPLAAGRDRPQRGSRRFDVSDEEEEEAEEEELEAERRIRRSVIRDISLSPSAGSCRTGSSGVTSGLEDYLFKPPGLDLGGAGGDEDNFSLPGSGRLLRGGLVLPSVEDGLSSGANSEVNSPRISPRAARRGRASAGNSLAKTYTGSGSGLLNQGLMRAITDDIRDIKKAIAENVDLPPVLPSLSSAPGPGKDLRELVRPPQSPPPAAAASSSSVASNAQPDVEAEPEEETPPPPQRTEDACESPGSERTDGEEGVWTKRPHSSSSSNAVESDPAGVNSSSASALTSQSENASPSGKASSGEPQRNSQRSVPEYESDEDTEKLLTKAYDRDERVEIPELQEEKENQEEKKRRGREVLIEGVLFRARYLGSTQLVTEGQPSKATRMVQAQEAVGRIKAPEGESQPSTDVDLFVSTEKIMVLNTNLKEIMMDHSLKTISYIADIGDVLVIMARRRLVPMSSPSHEDGPRSGPSRQQIKVICHVFESDEAQLIAQSIGHAFQVAYMEFLKANGIEDPSVFKEMDYQEVLNQQEIFGEELALFSDKQQQKEVIIPKQKGEPLGVVIVESGWGSMIPTVVLANMKPTGPAARCGQLNIGDQIIAVNGHSLVGLPLAQCQQRVKMCRKCSSVQLSLVSCSPVVQVRIKRPDLKYQLGFSLQNGVICSLLRGGIAERGGVRVGHRIIEINGDSVVGVAHERMVNMLSTCVGEIRMRTMPTCIFRLMTGQEEPVYI